MAQSQFQGTTSSGVRSTTSADPILCRCRPWRENRMADHIDHAATYERDRRLGRVFDEFYFDAVAIEARLDPAELAR